MDGADTEQLLLHKLARRTGGNPVLRSVLKVGNATDPRAQREDLGDASVYAGQPGIANLKRITEFR